MLRIGISQRVDNYPDRNEKRDALDQRWAELLWSLDIVAIPLNSLVPDSADYLKTLELDGFLLSGGNDVGEVAERDNLETAMLDLATEEEIPVLGVCRGMQFINFYANGKMRPVLGHVGQSHPVFGSLPEKYNLGAVNSYHNQGIDEAGIGKNLRSIARSQDAMIEALCHEYLPWLGIMWHPERNSPFSPIDKQIIADHFGVKK